MEERRCNSIEDIRPKTGERAIIFGMSGSGKTNLAMWMHHKIPEPLLVIDPKRHWRAEGYNRIVRPVELYWQMKFKRFPILFQPSHEDFGNPKVYDRLFKDIFNRRSPMRIYIDELSDFANAQSFPRYLAVCCKQGRGLGIGVTTCAQRPVEIPKCTYSEAANTYAFYLNSKNDRRDVAENMPGYDGFALAKYEFFYHHIDWHRRDAEICAVPEFPARLRRGFVIQ